MTGAKKKPQRRSQSPKAAAQAAVTPAVPPKAAAQAAVTPDVPQTSPQKSWRQKVFSFSTLKLSVAFVAGMATLTIAYATYHDAHQADVNSITEQQQDDAEGVSFAQDNSGKNNLLGATIITNNSNAPVHFVVFNVDVVLFNHIPSSAPTIRTFAFFLFNIPACSVGTINITNTAFAEMMTLMQPHHFRYAVVDVQSMSFTDRYNVSWRYSRIGQLNQGPGLPQPSGRTTSISVPFKASTGCS